MRIYTSVLLTSLLFGSPLAAEWHLQGTREFPPRVPAWKFTSRLPKDTSYEPVVCGDLVLIGCSHHNALVALDAAIGEERWRFYTNGPIRHIPVTRGDCVYVGSDDGHLYCLDAKGNLRWRVRGGPSDRASIGHDRLVSVWPISCRPLVSGDSLFCIAGHWPTEGVSVRAMDARTGRQIWSNDTAQIRPYGQMRIRDGALFVDCRGTGGAFDGDTGAARDDKRPRWEPPSAAGENHLRPVERPARANVEWDLERRQRRESCVEAAGVGS